MDAVDLLSYRKTVAESFPKSKTEMEIISGATAGGKAKTQAGKMMSSSLPAKATHFGSNFDKFDTSRHVLSSSLSTTYASSSSSSSSSASTTSEDELTTARRYSDSNHSTSSLPPADQDSCCGDDQTSAADVALIKSSSHDSDDDHTVGPSSLAVTNEAFVVDEEDLCNNNAVINEEMLAAKKPKAQDDQERFEEVAIVDHDEIEITQAEDRTSPKTMFAMPSSFVSFYVNGRRCSVMLSHEALIYEPELIATTKKNQNVRVCIPLNHIVAVWTCLCNKRPAKSTKPVYCACLVSDPVRKSLNVPEVDPSVQQPSFVVKIFYANPSNNDGLKLEMLSMSAHDANNKAGIDARAASEHLLVDLAYKMKDLLEGFDRPKHLLMFINPFGGSKKATKIFDQQIKPILDLAHIQYTVVVTNRANHAKDLLTDESTDLSQFDGIICVGGDGMFGEILNGVLVRTQMENRVNFGSVDSRLVRPNIKLGVIPAGSTDAIVYATNNSSNPINSLLSILLGMSQNIDVTAVHQRDEDRLIRYTATFVGYGFFGDTMVDSERNRWMGPRRYDWAGIKKFFSHKLYSGEIKLTIEPSDGSPNDYKPCGVSCETCKKAAKHTKQIETLSDENSPACVSIRGRFLAINAATVSCRCGMSKLGMSPMAHVGNGCTDLILVSKCSRLNYLRFLFRVAMSNKSPFDFSFVDTYRVREFEFNPIVEPHKRKGYFYEKQVDFDFFEALEEEVKPKSSAAVMTASEQQSQQRRSTRRPGSHSLGLSVWNCDGEILRDAAIHVKVHCQLVTVFATGCDVERLLGARPTKVRFQ